MKRRRAFTLVEVMIAIGLTAIVAVPLYYILSDSYKRANITAAKNYIEQEANKVLKFLENDISQAKYGSFEVKGNTISMKVHIKKDNHGIYGAEKEDFPVLKYTFNKPKLHRYLENKCWLVSNQVESLKIKEPPADELKKDPGKRVIELVMKSNMIGIKDSEQPTYEQNKIVSIREYSAKDTTKNWFGVGKSAEYEGDNNLLSSLKTDMAQLVIVSSEDWEEDLEDIKKKTVAEMENQLSELKDSYKSLDTDLNNMNSEIADLDYRGLYGRGT